MEAHPEAAIQSLYGVTADEAWHIYQMIDLRHAGASSSQQAWRHSQLTSLPNTIFGNQLNTNLFEQSAHEQRLKQLASTPELMVLGYDAPKVPDEMLCPISQRIMEEPVYAGKFRMHAFDRPWLLEWLKISTTNPLTREPLISQELIHADDLKQRIRHFLIQNLQTKQFYKYCLKQGKTPEEYYNQSYRLIAEQPSLKLTDRTRPDPYHAGAIVLSEVLSTKLSNLFGLQLGFSQLRKPTPVVSNLEASQNRKRKIQ